MAKTETAFAELMQGIRRKQFAPIYLFHGEELFFADEATALIMENALSPQEREFNLDILYGGETNARDIVAVATSYPMSASHRVVVVRSMDRLSLGENEADLLASYVQNPLQSTVLVLVAAKVDMRKKPYSTVKKAGVVFECRPLFENEVPRWIAARVGSMEREITPEATKVLSAYVNSSLRDIQQEIEKLLIFCGDRKTITEDDVTSVVGISKEFNVFSLQKAVGRKDLGMAMQIAERMVDAGEEAILIVAMLTRYFVSLWKLSDLRQRNVPRHEQAREAGVHPYFLDEYLEGMQQFQSREIEAAFDSLVRADEYLKTSPTDPVRVLQVLLTEVIGFPAVARSLAP